MSGGVIYSTKPDIYFSIPNDKTFRPVRTYAEPDRTCQNLCRAMQNLSELMQSYADTKFNVAEILLAAVMIRRWW